MYNITIRLSGAIKIKTINEVFNQTLQIKLAFVVFADVYLPVFLIYLNIFNKFQTRTRFSEHDQIPQAFHSQVQ